MEIPRETPEAAPSEREKPAAESPEIAPEAVDAAIEKTAKEFASEEAAIEAFGEAELDRVTSAADIPKEEFGADPGFQEAKRELGDVAAQGKSTVDSFTKRLSGVGARMKRLGRAIVAGAVLSGSAMNVAEAAQPPDHGPKLEHVEKARAKTPQEVRREAKETMLARADVLDQIKATLRKEIGSDKDAEKIRAEFAEEIERWHEEEVDAEFAKLARMSPEAFARKRLSEVVILTDEQVAELHRQDPLQDTEFNAMFKDGKMFLKVSEFIQDGKLQKGIVQHAQTHENAHKLHEVPSPGDPDDLIRPWDRLGVSPDIGEGAAEALAIAVDRNRGIDAGYQAYAGGNLAAGRLLQEAVGMETLAKDFLNGTVDGTRAALDRKFGLGAGDAALSVHFMKKTTMEDAGKRMPEGLATVMDLVRAGVDHGKAWREAKDKEGYTERMDVSADGHSVVLTKDIRGELVVANGVFEDPDPLSPNSPPLRLFAMPVPSADRPTEKYVEMAAEALGNTAEINERVVTEFQAKFKDAFGPDFMNDPTARKLYLENVAMERVVARGEAGAAGKLTAEFNLVLDLRSDLAPMRERYRKAAPEERGRIQAEMSAFVDRTLRETAKKIRLEMLTPPIPHPPSGAK
ncbi:MAG TPA: hypothetical protein VLC10_05335 [Patescibacteria group bacterium]|nr:hypothetical protein [Patescibacteria group bacterium]